MVKKQDGAEHPADSDIGLRVRRLECVQEIEREVRNYGALCDEGPYDAEKLARHWVVDGHMSSGDDHYRSVDDIRDFFADLVATFTLHLFTNPCIDVDPILETAESDWYGMETPIISGSAYIAGFTHKVSYQKTGDVWKLTGWHQVVHFFSPTRVGWVDGAPIAEQRGSKGA